MGRRGYCQRFLTIAVATGWLLAGPAASDWLVTNDGEAVETSGEWEIKGKLVVFQTPNGTLSSMRLDQVDLEASEARTQEAKQPKTEPVEKVVVKKKATFILTDADVEHVDPSQFGPDAEEGAGEGEVEESGQKDEAGRTSLPSQMTVASWDQALNSGTAALEVTGTLRNDSEFFAASITLTVTIFDSDGIELASRSALVGNRALEPGETTPFKATFPGISGVVNAQFESSSFNAIPAKEDGEA